MSATFATWDHGQLYVYVRGQLVYKRWPTGQSRVFYLSGQP